MMASRVLSRFLPGLEDGARPDGTRESQYPHSIMESGQIDRFRDHIDEQELNNMLLESAPDSPEEADDDHRQHSARVALPSPPPHSAAVDGAVDHGHPLDNEEEEEDDVPGSLLMDNQRHPTSSVTQETFTTTPDDRFHQGQPSTQQTSSKQIHTPVSSRPRPQSNNVPQFIRRSTPPQIDPREQALWRWTNVTNVDGFLLQVYQYYTDHGIWSILLSRTIHILTTIFLFGLYMFLSSCVDFAKIPSSKKTSEILIPQCMRKTSFLKSSMLWLFVFWTTSAVFRYAVDIRRLWYLHEFYHHLLEIPDSDIQTIPWERVVEGLMKLRDSNPETTENLPQFLLTATSSSKQSKQRMDAHDIANRLMRRDNYYIAMINKDVIDFSLNVPFLGSRDFYSKSLEWCIGFCFENFIFDEHGHVQQSCLDIRNRQRMIDTLRRRLRFAAVISVFMAPFNIGAHCVYYFSRYYAEFRNTPAQLGARAFTPLAEWKMRDFNELEHDLRHRIKMAYPFADRYLNQFPKDKMNQTLQFVGLVTGTVAAILGIATLLDPELFLGFEVTPGRTAFFYLSISMGIFAATRSATPDDDEVHEPVMHLFEVIRYTHYCPQRWKRQLHSNTVRAEFSTLYQTKILIFAQELLSLVVAPFVLWRNSGSQSVQIIDFFRQFTVHVDGLGGLCNYAVFDFRKRKSLSGDDGNGATKRDTETLRDEYFGGTKDEKMAMSQYYFMQRLGQYDQQQASRYQRHVPIAMPPVFPPLSPLEEVTKPDQDTGLTARPRAQTHSGGSGPQHKSASPHQSVLLDLQQKRHTPGRSFRPLTSIAGRRGSNRRTSQATSSKHELDSRHQATDTNHVQDLTTSRLIEQDIDLADSWKLDVGDREDAERSDDTDDHINRKGNGVLDLLVEYSRAHTEGKGIRRGTRMVS